MTSSREPGSRTPESVLADVYQRVAHRRQRARHKVVLGVVVVLATGVAVPLALLAGPANHVRVTTTTPPRPPVSPNSTNPPRPNGALPSWAPPAGPTVAAPAVFVDGDNKGGIAVYDTATGQLIRTISAQTSGGPDQQPVLSSDRQTVYFAQGSAQPAAPCTGAIMSAPISAASVPTPRISVPGTIALEPSPSPGGRYLAWVGVTCPAGGVKSTLFVTDLTTGAKTTLGAFSGDNSDDGIAWSLDGRRLAIEDGHTLIIADPTRPNSLQHARAVPVADGCTLTNPAFIPHSGELAAVQTCGTFTSSTALVFNPNNGRATAVIAVTPTGSRITSLAVDQSGQHVLLGITPPAGNSTIDQVVHGALAPITTAAPTAAEW